jgi:hypothetical protein
MPRQFGTTGVQSYATAPAVGVAGSTYYNTALKLHFLSDGARWFEVSSDYIASRGPGLITNGSALLGTNYNWNACYDLVKSDHPVGAAGSFQPRGSNPQSTLCDELISVDPAGYYDMTFAYRQVAGDASASSTPTSCPTTRTSSKSDRSTTWSRRTPEPPWLRR